MPTKPIFKPGRSPKLPFPSTQKHCQTVYLEFTNSTPKMCQISKRFPLKCLKPAKLRVKSIP